MKKLALVFGLLLILSSQGLCWSTAEAKKLALQLSQSQELPVNVRLRMEIMANEMEKVFDALQDPDPLLDFYQDTYRLAWSRPLSPQLAPVMTQFDDNMVKLFNYVHKPVQLSQVGYAPQNHSALLGGRRLSAETLARMTKGTEDAATELLKTRSSAELLFLRDNLARLREDLADGNVASNSVRGVLGARVRYLVAGQAVNGPFLTALTELSESLRDNFSPQELRQRSGKSL